jgi:hypothetical protein
MLRIIYIWQRQAPLRNHTSFTGMALPSSPICLLPSCRCPYSINLYEALENLCNSNQDSCLRLDRHTSLKEKESVHFDILTKNNFPLSQQHLFSLSSMYPFTHFHKYSCHFIHCAINIFYGSLTLVQGCANSQGH